MEFDKIIKQRFQALLDDSNKEEAKDEDPYVLELLSQFRGGDGKRKVETLPAEKDESTAQMARDLLRSCFKVEEQAANIRSKVSGTSVRPTLVSSDFYGGPTSAPKVAKPLKTSTLSKQERLVLASATQNEDQAEDAMLALSLLQQYKKDPSFIQRELKDQAKRRDKVLGQEQPLTKAVPQPSALFNPVLIQEERHRAINEKRDARKKEQRLRQLEESKERRIAKPMKEGLTKPGINRDIEPVMLHSGTTPVKREDGMIDVERIKEAKLKIEQEALESQEEVRRIKEDLKRYKKELQERDKAQRDLEAQQNLKQKLEEDRLKMQQELERTKRQMNEYQLSKFAIIINGILAKRSRQFKGQSFRALAEFSQHLRFKELKLIKLNRCSLRGRFFRLWRDLKERYENEREMEAYEREQQIMAARELTAENHRKRVLRRMAMRAIKKHTKLAQQERAIEREHEARKNAIDEFFVNLKDKARAEEERLKREKLEKLQKDQIKERLKEATQGVRLATPNFLSTHSQFEVESSIPYFITPSNLESQDNDTINFDQYNEEKKSSEQQPLYDLVPSRQFDTDLRHQDLQTPSLEAYPDPSQGTPIMIQPFNPDDGGLLTPETVQSSQHSKKLKLPERPKHVLEMEERAKSRKDKRDQLKKTYEEKQKKIEEERKAAEARKEEERKKKLADEKEAKRAGKMEEAKKKEEERLQLEREKVRIQEAREYYNRGLMIKYGMVPLSKNLERAKQNETSAIDQHLRRIKLNGLQWLRQAVKESKAEEQRKDQRLMYMAKHVYEMNLIKRCLKAFVIHGQQSEVELTQAGVIYLKSILKRAIAHWRVIVPILKLDRTNLEEKEELIARKFRMRRMGRRVIQAMREVTKASIIEREKSAYKQKMWSKVNTWLSDFDQKPELGPSTPIKNYDHLDIDAILGQIHAPHQALTTETEEDEARFSFYKSSSKTGDHHLHGQGETQPSDKKAALLGAFGTIDSFTDPHLFIAPSHATLGIFDDVTLNTGL